MPWEKDKGSKSDKPFGAATLGVDFGEGKDHQAWTTVSGKEVDPDAGIASDEETVNPLLLGYRDNTKLPHKLKPDPITDTKTKNTYTCSDGTRVTQTQIDSRYAATCKAIDMFRPPICQGTNRGDVALSHSHTISRARCKELGKAELIWDSNNIELEGYEEATSNPTMAHNIWECGTIKQKFGLLNFDRKMKYLYKYDIQTYVKLIMEMQSELGLFIEYGK